MTAMSERFSDEAKAQAREIAGLQIQVKDLKRTVGTLIAWITQSANSPIRRDEAMTLLNMLDGLDR